MNQSGDAADQIIRISIEGVDYAVRIAGASAKNISALIMAAMRTKKAAYNQLKTSGQERMKKMIKSGKPLDVFSIQEKDLKSFTQATKKYGIVYCAIREKKPRQDGMVDIMVCKDDSPKINRVMERLQYSNLDKSSNKSETVQSREEKQAETPDRNDNLNVDRFFNSVMPDEGKAVQAEQPKPEVKQEDFFTTLPNTTGRNTVGMKQNPSEHGYESMKNTEGITANEPELVKDRIKQAYDEIKARNKNKEAEIGQNKGREQQTTRHKQPNNKQRYKNIPHERG